MPRPNPQALEFLLTRRSRPAKTLAGPVPSRAELQTLLTAAARTPDHGKLEPFRFLVIEGPAMSRLAELAEARGKALGHDADKIAKGRSQFDQGHLAVAVIGRSQFDQGHLAVAVIEVQKPSEKIPAIEQTYTAGAVCLALLNAALAAGWGANWLSGWPSHDPVFCADALGLAPHERVAGLVHIATETNAPPERPRPDLASITSYLEA